MGKGVRTSPRDALLAANSNDNTGTIFGFHRSMDTLGAVAGPLVAVLLLYIYPGEYTLIFIATLLPSIFAVYFTWLVKDKKVTRNSKNKLYKEFWNSAPAEYKKMLLLITIFSLVNSSDIFLILKSKEISQSDFTAILGYVFYNFIYAFFSYPAGILSDRFGKKKIFISGLVVFSIVYLGFAQDVSLHLIWILFALYGIYSAATEGIAKAWVSDLIVDNYKATAIGLLNTCMSMAILLGSFFTGILSDQFGAALPFYLSAGISFAVALVLFVLKIEN
ncbi:MAG: MFS transporter [Ignavibacteria bacterium]